MLYAAQLIACQKRFLSALAFFVLDSNFKWCIHGVDDMKILNYPSSGSYQNLTFSRNRFGQYVRGRAIPVNPSSTFQVSVRTRFAVISSAWRGLTSAQRTAWADFGTNITRTDSLGQTYQLNGFEAYFMVNSNKLAAGDAVITDPILYAVPAALLTLTPTLTSASFSLAYTTTPLAAGVRSFIYCSPQRSAGRTFENDLRLITVTAAAAASPANILAAYTARFGAPITGNRIFISVANYLAGVLSDPLLASQVVA